METAHVKQRRAEPQKVRKTMEKTNAMRQLDRKKLEYTTHTYEGGALSGAEVARTIGVAPERVFKTLVTTGKSGGHYVFMIPVEAELNLKKAAAAVGEKAVAMLHQRDLLPLTGYIHGGCSPVGMKKLFPTVIDRSAANFERICFSAGKVGMMLETTTAALAAAVPIESADITE